MIGLILAQHFLGAKWRGATLRGEALARYQNRRARRMAAWAAAHSPFYRAHWSGYDLDDWRTLPTVDKARMMAHFDTFNTRGVRLDEALEVALEAEGSRDFVPLLGDLTVGLSSGTSGHRGLFLVSPEERAGWAGTIMARTLHGWPRFPLRVAFFLRANSRLYTTLDSRLIHVRYLDLMLPLSEAVAGLNQFQPDWLVGPPSLLGYLADAREQGQLWLRPRRLISVAEVLEPQDQVRLASVFDAPVHQIYQCTEGLLGVSCAYGRLHLQEDLVAFQFEPVAGDEAEPGQPQRVMPIVTDLWRTTQPILRYRLNDILRLDPCPCPCGSGFQVVEAIEGRSDDVLLFEQITGGRRPVFPDTLRRAILLAHAAIQDYRVCQITLDTLHVYLSPAPNADGDQVADAVRSSLMHTLAGYGCRLAHIEVSLDIPPLPPAVKRRRVQRLWRAKQPD